MPDCVDIPTPTPSGKIWKKEKRRKRKRERETGQERIIILCVLVPAGLLLIRVRRGVVDLFHLVKGLRVFSFKRFTNCSEDTIRARVTSFTY